MILERTVSPTTPIDTTLPTKDRLSKADVVAQVAAKTEMTKTEVKKVVDAMLDILISELGAGNKVILTGFGTFEVRTTQQRVGVNPRTREKMVIPSKQRATFTAGAALKRVIEE